ncbi:hypothetical protein DFH09DRAFT_1282319 [Mycena vulgaris]|nr:hypothetical protein DFH09DRAFT_1282319 [Mycena vulgaris]
MATVAAIRARIKEISLAIKRQKEILRDLENSKRDAQSDLNNIRDPMAKLPFELSSDIFMRCLADGTPGPHPNAAPMVFMRVCRSWSKIAISTPSLWATIRAEYPDARFAKLMDVWLARARNRPLSIALTIRGPFNSAVCQSVLRYAGQVHALELYLPSGDDLEHITTPFPSLKTLIIGQGPRDEDSDEDSDEDPDDDEEPEYSSGPSECIEMLRAAPGLVDCTLDGIFYAKMYHGYDFGACDELTHHNLTNLRLNSSALILRYATLPALENLDLSFCTDIEDEQFRDFLSRSSPPLKSLKMMGAKWLGGITERIFQLLPNLTDLEMGWSLLTISILLEELAVASPTQFLPNLCKFTICGFNPDRSQYGKLIATLSARRASHSPMKSFRLESVYAKPDADITTALQQLAADGMMIHISTGGTNLI